MKLSTKARYGTRAMMDLAMHDNEEPVQLKEIAQRQRISLSYLEHLVTPLVAAGLVRSTRGARGGMVLARPPEQIRLSEIVEVLEGPLAIVDCLRSSRSCPRSGMCATQDVWGELKLAMDNILSSTTLKDLSERQRVKEEPPTAMYHI